MRKILVVCSGNICRSPMAEGILRHLIESNGINDTEVRSAGTLGIVGSRPSDAAVTVCLEKDIDISGLESSALDDASLAWADIVLGMEEEHLQSCRELAKSEPPRLTLLGSYGRPLNPEIDDPMGQDLDVFRRCRDLLFCCADHFVAKELLAREPTS